MNDTMLDRKLRSEARTTPQVRAADVGGVVWGHSNPAELYRWISRRNDLLQTIAEAFPAATPRPLAG